MILVTGAAGFVGASLMRALAGAEIPTRAYQGRINDPYGLREQLGGVEAVIHLAGAESRGRPRALNHVDVDGAARLLEEARAAGVQRLLVLSRLGADANSLYPLLRAKGEAEDLVRQGRLPYTIVRTTSLFGRRDRYFNHIAGLASWSRPFLWLPGGGFAPAQPLWVEDAVRCLLLALERDDLVGKTISLGGDERVRYEVLARTVAASAGVTAAIPLRMPLLLVRLLSGPLFGWWPRPPVTRFWLDRFSAPDITELDSVRYHFGFRPASWRRHIAYLRRPGLRWQLLGRGAPG